MDEVNGEMVVEDNYAIIEIDDKTDEILVKHDEIVEVMSVEDIIKFYEDEKVCLHPMRLTNIMTSTL